ncbi:ATPase, T2SS/T4P/T4SS family [Alkaliphilus sp. B6464]|uniref:ATPase, T2SS/T4P/T4SS family n=1 Tax=Alkaliphilus sp. B6464 TaxID=2731219 RepID=UPI001BA9D5DF|nr:ATPase, T2SS/T4P/T4SS family [Alkaliphilus sp. B6464]QUH22005.1 CpaF family protein [Alkaliphilus sp. B6464]
MGTINFLKASYNVNLMREETRKLTVDQLNELIEKITGNVVSKHSDIIKQIKDSHIKKEVLRSKIIDIIDEENILMEGISREDIIKRVVDEVFGYSILQKYIDDPEVNDIMVNDFDVIYIRKNQTDIRVDDKFRDRNAYKQFLYKVSAFCGEKLNDSSPQVDGTDNNYGVRINITISPVNTYSPSLVIRKGRKHFPMEHILEQGNISKEMYDTFHLMSLVGSRVIFGGQLESGKTTFLNSYLNYILKRTVIMEDTPELKTTNPNTIYQRTTKSTTEEGLNITLADLVRNFRRTNAQHPVVGEVRGPEAVELLDIFNTGFNCGASSIHANSAQDVVNQLIFQIKASGKLGTERKEIEEYIGRTIDMIVYMEKRKVVEMVEIYYDYEKEKLVYHPIHKFVIEGEDANNLFGHFENKLNSYSFKMKDRIRRTGLVSQVPEEMMK